MSHKAYTISQYLPILVILTMFGSLVQAATVSLAASPSPATFGAPVTLTSTVSPLSATGKVTFYDGSTILGTSLLSGGTATLSTRLNVTGNRSLIARYLGDIQNPGSVSPIVIEAVNPVKATGFTYASVASGINPTAPVVADFNGDGKLDIVVVGTGNVIDTLLGNGNGSFSAPLTTIAPSGTYNYVAAADFNQDGKLDIAVANPSDGTVKILFGQGNGTFGSPISLATSDGFLLVADFNGDGKADLAVAHTTTNGIGIVLGNGDGTFAAPVEYQSGPATGIHAVGLMLAAGDMNGDGKVDLVTIAPLSTDDHYRNIAVLFGNGDGTLAAPVNHFLNIGAYNWVDFFALEDVDGDGQLDLAIQPGYAGPAYVLIGDGIGGFGTPVAVVGGMEQGGTGAIAILDIDGDGHRDILADLVVGIGNHLQLDLNGGNGSFKLGGYAAPPVKNLNYLIPADFNGDGRVDLLSVALDPQTSSWSLWVFSGALQPLLQVTKTHIGDFTAGQFGATFSVSVGNAPGTLPTAGMVTVTETIQPDFTLVSMAGVGWSCSGITCSRSDALAAGSTYPPITVTVNVAGITSPYQLNWVSAGGGGSLTAEASDSVNIISINCSYTLSALSSTGFAIGGPQSISVTAPAGCPWTAVNNSAPWITLTSGTPGLGNGTLNFSLLPNGGGRRSATLLVAGQLFSVLQAGFGTLYANTYSATAGRQILSFVAGDGGPPSDIQYVQLLFTMSGLSALNACYVSYDPAANVFYLLSDDMTQWYGLLGGSANTIGNAQCTIHGANSGSIKGASDLTTNIDISFRSAFGAPKAVYEFAGNGMSIGSGWQLVAILSNTVDPSAVELISMTPSSGTGASQVFTAVIRDGDGAATIPFAQLVINSGLSGFNGCFIHYDRASNVFFLLNDSGTVFSGLVAGSAGQVSNSQCTLHGAGSGGTAAGSDLTVSYNLDFSASFAGAKQIFMQAVDNSGVIEVWHQMGTWIR